MPKQVNSKLLLLLLLLLFLLLFFTDTYSRRITRKPLQPTQPTCFRTFSTMCSRSILTWRTWTIWNTCRISAIRPSGTWERARWSARLSTTRDPQSRRTETHIHSTTISICIWINLAHLSSSGKTYTATKAFQESASGIYCGPLKLLAREVYNKCNQTETKCDLITGEERYAIYNCWGL